MHYIALHEASAPDQATVFGKLHVLTQYVLRNFNHAYLCTELNSSFLWVIILALEESQNTTQKPLRPLNVDKSILLYREHISPFTTDLINNAPNRPQQYLLWHCNNLNSEMRGIIIRLSGEPSFHNWQL